MTLPKFGYSLAPMQVNIEALEAIRKAGGDTQKTLAARTGISENSLNFIEQGKKRPRATTIRKLADALSVPVGAITIPEDHKQAS